MSTPTKKQWQTVIDNFYKVLPQATRKHHLDMWQTSVNDQYECGTVHCIGGWYAIATLDLKMPLTYIDGARRMAQDLNFSGDCEAENWARDNTYIWGNSYGAEMFSNVMAYNRAKTLKEVITYLEGVRDRSPD